MMIINKNRKTWVKAQFCYGDIRKDLFAEDLEGYMDGVLHRGDSIVCFGRNGTLFKLTFQETILHVHILTTPSKKDYEDMKKFLLAPNDNENDDVYAELIERAHMNDMFLYGVPMTVLYYHTGE